MSAAVLINLAIEEASLGRLSFSVEPGLFLGAVREEPRQKGRSDIKAAGDRMSFSRGLPKSFQADLRHAYLGPGYLHTRYASVKPPESPYTCPVHSRENKTNNPPKTRLCEIKLGCHVGVSKGSTVQVHIGQPLVRVDPPRSNSDDCYCQTR